MAFIASASRPSARPALMIGEPEHGIGHIIASTVQPPSFLMSGDQNLNQ